MLTRTYYESRIVERVHMGGHHVGMVETVKRESLRGGRETRIRCWCTECVDDVDAQGNIVDNDDPSHARHHATAEAAEAALGLHVTKCDALIAEIARGRKAVAA